jgi:3-deoxy-7-phosphoheptulonate synthase
VTDACVSWETTEEMLLSAHEVLRGALTKRRAA